MDEIVRRFKPEEFIETGTFLGSTTRYLARRYGIPVYSIEIDPIFYSYSKLRVLGEARAHVRKGTSMRLLKKRARSQQHPLRTVFYLDAHFYEVNPLRDEVRFIFDHWKDAVIMIDDFVVEGDPGYRFDRDGDQPLSLEYLHLPDDPFYDAYFPAHPSEQETGNRQGSLLLALGPSGRAALGGCVPEWLRRVPTVARPGGGHPE